MIIHNLIPDDYKDKLQKIICSSNFDWYWYDSSADPEHDKVFMLAHPIYVDSVNFKSKYYDDIAPLLKAFEKETNYIIKKVDRIKINLSTQRYVSEEDVKKTMHRDWFVDNTNHISMIYYVNDSDGDTLIHHEDGYIERSSPKAGNAVWFESKLLHYGRIPLSHPNRIVINFVFEVE